MNKSYTTNGLTEWLYQWRSSWSWAEDVSSVFLQPCNAWYSLPFNTRTRCEHVAWPRLQRKCWKCRWAAWRTGMTWFQLTCELENDRVEIRIHTFPTCHSLVHLTVDHKPSNQNFLHMFHSTTKHILNRKGRCSQRGVPQFSGGSRWHRDLCDSGGFWEPSSASASVSVQWCLARIAQGQVFKECLGEY